MTTSEVYVDGRRRATVGLGHLLERKQSNVAQMGQPEASHEPMNEKSLSLVGTISDEIGTKGSSVFHALQA
jgi:hypothetical protein